MEASALSKELEESTEELLKIIRHFPDENFNKRPEKGGWSAGEVVEHLIKVETGTLRMFSGESQKADRDPREKVKTIKEKMLNFENKMNAPAQIVPDEKSKDKKRALNKLQDIRQSMLDIINTRDLAELLTGFEHPFFGLLTRTEWIYFNIYHGRRHAHQIKQLQRGMSD